MSLTSYRAAPPRAKSVIDAAKSDARVMPRADGDYVATSRLNWKGGFTHLG